MEAAAATPGQVAQSPAGVWWTAFLRTLYESQLRLRSVLKLPRACLDVQHGCLHLPAGTDKRRAGQTYRLSPDTLEALGEIRGEGQEATNQHPLFAWPEEKTGRPRSGLEACYAAILARAGVPIGTDPFNKIRRTARAHLAGQATWVPTVNEIAN